MKRNNLFNLFVMLSLVLALGPMMPFSAVEAAPLRYTQINSDTTWSTNQTLTTDVVVQSGATLTIEDITVMANASDAAPYGGGLSPKIEIIVENGGKLVVEPGAGLGAITAGDWYGVVFLPGSSGSVTGANILYGTVGVTIHGASPVTITQNNIAYMTGVTPVFPAGSEGGWAAGIVISGAASAQVISNTIEYIMGGNGVAGLNGSTGSGGFSGGDGTDGGKGGDAYGIWVQGGATPTVSNNTIKFVQGGSGADAGSGGDGSGCAFSGDGAWGGNGADAGHGGNANGIYLDTAGGYLSDNTLAVISGGAGGHGGDGGGCDSGCNGNAAHPTGGYGGNGGSAGNGGDGGYAVGINIASSSPSVHDNEILFDIASGYNAIAGGTGGSAGISQNGLAGGNGYEPAGSGGVAGGDGGLGGNGGNGANGGCGGAASGIFVNGLSGSAVPWLVHNSSSGIITGGAGGDGSAGADGGDGGYGGDGEVNGLGVGGDGGNGGNGGGNGNGGNGGDGGTALGIYSLGTQAEPVLSRNSTAMIRGNNAGDAGNAGIGGAGGTGGKGGGGAFTGNGGNGGDGGSASGSIGGDGGAGGDGFGIYILVTSEILVQNNLAHTIMGGQGSGGGNGGTGGLGGDGGSGDVSGSGGDGGAGGSGGSGGDIGEGSGIAVYTTTHLYHNTINNVVSGGAGVMAGGGAGLGGNAGTPFGNVGASGFSGGAGSPGYGYGIHITSGQPKIVNNIVSYVTDGTPNSTIEYGIYSVANIPGVDVDRDFNNVYNWDANYYQAPAGVHDISQDPSFEDRLNGDHHLKANSPCIDAGDDGSHSGMGLPTEDIDGDSRPNGLKYDIGADEFLIKHYVYLPLVLRNP